MCSGGCLFLIVLAVAIPILGVVGFVVLSMAFLPSTIKSSVAAQKAAYDAAPPWPPKEIEIKDGVEYGVHDTFVFCDNPATIKTYTSDIEAHVKEIVSSQPASEQTAFLSAPFEQAKLMDASSKDVEAKMGPWLAGLEDQCVKEDMGMYVPAGKYKVTGFFDSNTGEKITLDENTHPDTAYAEIVYKGRKCYSGMGLGDLWNAHYSALHPAQSLPPEDPNFHLGYVSGMGMGMSDYDQGELKQTRDETDAYARRILTQPAFQGVDRQKFIEGYQLGYDQGWDDEKYKP